MSHENDPATKELLDTLDALYPLPIARNRKLRIQQTSEAVTKWMRAQFAALENEVPKVMSAALAAVQQETREACAKWMQHLPGCAERRPRHYRMELGEGYESPDGEWNVSHVKVPVEGTGPGPCSCGLSEHLKALSAPKAPRPEATRAGSPPYSGWMPIKTYRGSPDPVVVWNGRPWLGYEESGMWFADVEGEMLRIDPAPTAWLPAPPGGLVDHLQG